MNNCARDATRPRVTEERNDRSSSADTMQRINLDYPIIDHADSGFRHPHPKRIAALRGREAVIRANAGQPARVDSIDDGYFQTRDDRRRDELALFRRQCPCQSSIDKLSRIEQPTFAKRPSRSSRPS
jgi:hypothetical protein